MNVGTNTKISLMEIFINDPNKLECLSSTSLSVPVWCWWVRQGAYFWLEHLKRDSLGLTAALHTIIRIKRSSGYKHLCLLPEFVNNGRKKFYDIGPRKFDQASPFSW